MRAAAMGRPAAQRCAFAGLMMAAATLAGCATTGTEALRPAAKTDGASGLTQDELTWNCGRLENAIDIKIARILELQKAAKSEATTTAPTLEKLFGRWSFGNTADNNNALASIKKERAEADAYNARLPSVGCLPVDIDARLTPPASK